MPARLRAHRTTVYISTVAVTDLLFHSENPILQMRPAFYEGQFNLVDVADGLYTAPVEQYVTQGIFKEQVSELPNNQPVVPSKSAWSKLTISSPMFDNSASIMDLASKPVMFYQHVPLVNNAVSRRADCPLAALLAG